MRPFDPRLLRTAPAARLPVAVLAVVGVFQGVATIGLTFALTALVVAVVEGGDRSVPLRWLLGAFALRAVLGWIVERVAAWAGVEVSTALRRALIERWLASPAERRPSMKSLVVAVA